MIYIGNKNHRFCNELNRNLREAFSKIKEEFGDHLEAINENTNEINANYEYLLEIDMKIEKLNENIEELYMMLSENKKKKYTKDSFKQIYLTLREQEIFTLLYARNGDLIELKELSRTLGLTDEMIDKSIAGMIIKGIPIIKRYVEDKVYLVLDEEFRNLQAREKVIQISDVVKRKMY